MKHLSQIYKEGHGQKHENSSQKSRFQSSFSLFSKKIFFTNFRDNSDQLKSSWSGIRHIIA